MMDCRQALARLYEYLDGELTADQALEVRQHLEACRPCFDLCEFERLLAGYLRKSTAGGAAPEQFKARIATRLRELGSAPAGAEEELFPTPAGEELRTVDPVADTAAEAALGYPPERMRRAIWPYMLVAAALVLVALPFVQQRAPAPGGTGPLPNLISLHAAEKPEFQTTDPDLLMQWVTARAASNPMAHEFQRAGCGLRGAAIDSIWTHLFAVSEQVPVSVFVTECGRFARPPAMTRVNYEGEDYFTAKSGNYAMVMWECPEGGVTCLAVAALPSDNLLHLAHAAELAARGE